MRSADQGDAAVLFGETKRIGDRGPDIVEFQARVVIGDFLGRKPLGQSIENHRYMNPRVADMGPAAANSAVYGDPGEQPLFVSHWTREGPRSSSGK